MALTLPQTQEGKLVLRHGDRVRLVGDLPAMNVSEGDAGMVFTRELWQAREPDDPFYKVVFESENGRLLELSLQAEDVQKIGPQTA